MFFPFYMVCLFFKKRVFLKMQVCLPFVEMGTNCLYQVEIKTKIETLK